MTLTEQFDNMKRRVIGVKELKPGEKPGPSLPNGEPNPRAAETNIPGLERSVDAVFQAGRGLILAAETLAAVEGVKLSDEQREILILHVESLVSEILGARGSFDKAFTAQPVPKRVLKPHSKKKKKKA